MATTRIKIGRATDSNVVIDERWDTVSNEHAEIVLRDGELVYIDHSSNGTVINKQKIQNREVGIYPGDCIMLAGVYELKWDVINGFFPQSKRPTVIKNIRAEQDEDVSRKTVYTGNVEPTGRNARATEQIKVAPQRQHSFVQHGNKTLGQTSDNVGKENEYSQAEMDSILEKWNWGGFFTTWIWGVFNRLYWTLLIIPVAFIPYVGQVASLALAVYLGLYGSKLAWAKGKYANFSAFVSVQKKWAYIGFFLFIMGIVFSAASVYYVLQIL